MPVFSTVAFDWLSIIAARGANISATWSIAARQAGRSSGSSRWRSPAQKGVFR